MFKRLLFILSVILILPNAALALDFNLSSLSTSDNFMAAYNFVQNIQNFSTISLSHNFKISIDPTGIGCALNLSPAVTLSANNTGSSHSLTISIDLDK